MNNKYYLTTAIAYTSKIPHIGNVYEAIFSDALARYKRLEGREVYFLTGTDEHGQKIQKQAEEEGRSPQALVDEIAGEIRRIWDRMNISYDDFIRTTEPRHKDVVKKIFEKLYKQGDIYKGNYEGWYCVPDESFWTESQLVDGNCPDCGRPVQKASEEAYFLKLSKYQKQLEEHIEKNPTFIWPEQRKNEMVNNFLKPGLEDLCVSRTSFNWGVPVEFDEGHVVYVWLDALSNYITAIGYHPDGSSEQYQKLWPADVHIIGKDIVRFHTIYWPIILMALGEELPKQVFGHPWLLMNNEKMSKSRGNVLYTDELVDLFGVDAVRYCVLRDIPFDRDGSLGYQSIIGRINTDLANVLGNLLKRTIAMVDKYFNGEIPAQAELTALDQELIDLALATPKKVSELMDAYRVADALESIFVLLRRSNKYIDETEPWVLAKNDSDKERLGTVLYNLLESLRFSAVLLSAFMPDTAVEILKRLNTENRSLDSLKGFNGTVAGTKVKSEAPLFARLDEEKLLAEIMAAHAEPKIEFKEQIEYDDFAKLDMRVATVKHCEKHPKADRLLVFDLEIGSEEFKVVSGIAEFYQAKELIGKKVIWLANLKPRKIRGIESNGMILSAEKDGKLKLLTAEIGDGAEVG